MPTVAAREVLRVTTETVAGSYNSGGTVVLPRLTSNNAFRGIPTPMMYTIRDASSSNRLAQTGYGAVTTKCSLTTPWYFSQSKVLIANAIATGSPPVLPSVTIDHITMLEPGTSLIYTRYLGCFINKLTLRARNTGEGVICMLTIDYDFLAVATITVSDFAMPALSAYNTDKPVIFQMSAGNFTFNSSRTGFRAFDLTIANILDVIYDESAYPLNIKWCGDDISASTEFRFQSLADRNEFQAVTPEAASIAFTDGTNTSTFNFESQNYLTKVDDELNLNAAHYQAVGWSAYLDYSAGTNLVYTQTP